MVTKGKKLAVLLLLAASTTVTAQTTNGTVTTGSNCQPANCLTICSPSCSIDQVCTKKSMKDCGVCPALVCLSRTSLGLPPIATNSISSSNTNQNSSNDIGALVGGILGGLVGFGLLVGIGIYCYIKRNKRGKLPFAFTNGNASHIAQSQEKFQQQQQQQQMTPHPAVIAALSHQSSITSSSSKYIGLAELASGGSSSLQRQRSMSSTINTNATSRFNPIQTPLYNISNTNTITITPTNNDNSINTTVAPIMSTITSNIPEEFESKIALQNKRISEIIYNNPRLSQQPPQPPHIQHVQQRYSAYTTTDDEFEDEDDDKRSTMSTSTTQSNCKLSRSATTATVQAIQVARAKPQIMRVNSVKSTGNGLNRSESVRTVLTAIEDIQEFPATPNHRDYQRSNQDNPFEDKHYADNNTIH